MDFTRILIEKKKEFNREAERLYGDFKNYLGIKDLEDLRLINIYDIVNANKEEVQLIKDKVLFEEDRDLAYDEIPALDQGELAFRAHYLRGQFNQREASIGEMLKFLDLGEDIEVLSSHLIILKGVNEDQVEKIKSYYLNPIEMEELGLEDLSYEKEEETKEEVEVIDGFINFDSQDMESFKSDYGIGLDMEDLVFCQDYFKKQERDPHITEIKLVDTYWSDHCRHTTFTTEILDIEIEEGKYKEVFQRALKEYLASRDYVYGETDRPITFMDLAVINMKEVAKKGLLEDREISDEINAASIEIDVDVDGKKEKWLLMFKNETHNHPTEMEPFGGAGTCLGGAIRDPLSGRSFVYQAMRISGSADPRKPYDETLGGKLPQRKITQGAMKGYSSYGNEIGAATGYVKEIYHEGFLAKRMECGALVAAAPKRAVYRGSPKAGDLIVLIGGRTGRDGLGGAVGSSREHTEESLHTSGAEVQKGNPSLERKIMRLFRKEHVSKMIKVCNDFGAGGVGVAIGELADGIIIDLDKVPVKYPGLDGTEIALAESQERMAALIDEKDLDVFMEEIEKEDLEGTLVARVTEEKVLKMVWRDKEIVNIKRSFLDTNGTRKTMELEVEQPSTETYIEKPALDLKDKSMEEVFKELMKDLNVGSQKGLVENFDNTVGANNVLMPFGGAYQLSPSEGMVAKIPVLKGETTTCSIMTYGYDPDLSSWSPFHGGYYAVIESLARLVALGGDYRKARLTLQEYFERLGEDKKKWGKPLTALLGAFLVQKELDIASIGGKDSMSGSFEDLDVPPTLIAFAVGSGDVKNIVSNEFKEAGSQVVLLELKIDEEGLINFDNLKANYDSIRENIEKGNIRSAQTVKYGGIARAISEMSFGNKIGFKFNEIDRVKLFKPLYGSIILELKEEIKAEDIFSGLDYKVLGQTIKEELIQVGEEEISLNELIDLSEGVLDEVFPLVDKNIDKSRLKDKKETKEAKRSPTILKESQARVLIPVFTGSHGEYSLAQAFERAGAQVETLVFKTLTKKHIEESYKELARRIKEVQILGLPHGAILGGEPESGGKLLSLILNNPLIREEVNKHLEVRDGLILGIGDGFQGLLKSGLISLDQVGQAENSPLLVENKAGSFLSTMVDIEVTFNKSPWMAGMELGQVYTAPLATKEGKLIIREGQINPDQIASKFLEGNPTGSMEAIESLTSPDGRVLGTISAIDRIGEDLYKNIELKGKHKIFESAVKYFD